MSGAEGFEFAWCFGHGRLHANPDWCEAGWVKLDATTAAAALAEKQQRFGDARFLHELSAELQATVPSGVAIP